MAKVTAGDMPGATADRGQAQTVMATVLRRGQQASLARASGDTKRAKGDFDGAIADYDGALALQPPGDEVYQVHLARGYAKGGKGDFDGAMADLSQAIAMSRFDTDAYLNRGHVERQKGDFAAAQADCSAVIEINPAFDGTYEARALVRQALGDFAGALTDCEKRIELAADDARWPRIYRSLLLRRLHRRESPNELATIAAGWKDDWAKSIAQYLSGHLSESDLIAQGGEGETVAGLARHCEANYCIGMTRLLRNEPAAARGFLENSAAARAAIEKVAGPNATDFMAILAQAELGRLPSKK